MSRKTIAVQDIIDQVNLAILHSADSAADIRRGQAHILEQILHKTDNYNGFGYLSADEMKLSHAGTSVGIKEWKSASNEWNFEGTDATRVKYF